MATYTLTDGTRKTRLTISGDTTVVFPTKLDYFGVRSMDGADILVSKIKAPTTLEDGVYSTDEGDGDVVVDDGIFTDTLYLKGSGTVVVYGGAKPNHLPFKVGGKGGGGSSGGCNYKGTTTTAISNGSTTNPITIDGESYTAVFGDVVVYDYTEFVFDGTTWSEFGRPFDTTPTSGSANAVTSDGIYWNTAGKKSDNGKGEIFNTYTGFIKNIASGNKSHAEGYGAIASGNYSHAEGLNTTASGDFSHAGGLDTIATAESSTVIGRCNVADGTGAGDPKHLFIVGNGPDGAHRSNILEVDTTSLNVNGDIQQNGVPLRATTMPTITSSMLGKVVQYVGVSDSNYKQGWNYVAVSDGAAEPTYSWQALMDSTPTSGSNNPVTSGAVYSRTPFVRGTGANSAACGTGSRAESDNSISAGYYTATQYTLKAAFGKFNQPRQNDLFEIGNGVNNARSNIVEVNSTSMNVNGDIKKNGVSLPTPYTTMPTITAGMLGQIAMYVGTTDANYTQGYFYIASSDGAAEPTYSWVNLPVSPRTYSETVLWTNDGTTNPSTITLSSAYTNFDAIVIVHKHEEASNLYTSTSTYISSAVDINDMLGISLGDAPNLYTWYKLTAANELTISVSGLLLNKIIGIKY